MSATVSDIKLSLERKRTKFAVKRLKAEQKAVEKIRNACDRVWIIRSKVAKPDGSYEYGNNCFIHRIALYSTKKQANVELSKAFFANQYEVVNDTTWRDNYFFEWLSIDEPMQALLDLRK